MTKYILLIFFGYTTIFADVIKYETPDTKYSLEYSSGELKYRTHNFSYKFTKNQCSVRIVENFWNEKSAIARKLPKYHPSKQAAVVTWNKQKRKAIKNAKRELANVPSEIQTLIIREAAACAR